jgi:hypothetical protein
VRDVRYVNMHANILCTRAEVLVATESVGDARPALEQAIDLYERKGNVVAARRTRSALGKLSPN